jgi:predicted phosphoribosyltransferase
LVQGLYAGGVIVGREIARALAAPLEVAVTLRMGAPGYDDLNIGGVASGGIAILDSRTIGMLGVPDAYIRAVGDAAAAEVARLERRVRGAIPPVPLVDRTVVLVDDGAHARWRVRAAARAAREAGARRVIFAVPVASSDALESIAEEADEVVCDHVPETYCGAAACYAAFEVPTLDRVRMELTRARLSPGRPAPRPAFSSYLPS